MKNLLTRFTAVTSLCVIALCNTAIPVSAEDVVEVNDITISFDCSEDGVIVDDEYKDLLEPIQTSPKSSITIPEAFPKREGYFFTGWTYDGIHAYTYGDAFRSPDGNDVALKPIWGLDVKEKVKYNFRYEVEQNGEIIDTSKELPDKELFAGQVVKISTMSYAYDDFAQFSWIVDGTEMRGNEKFVMPEHDVTITPAWKKRYKISYTVGDVDRVVGASFQEYVQPEGLSTDLQNNSRFSRCGFIISGWLCDDDNKVYEPMQSYIMPSHDVTFTAVWEPKEYTVVFRQDKNSQNFIKLKGLTDTEITTPEATITQDGKYLAGWKDEDGTVYPVGSQYMIKGAIPGKGISLDAVWEDGEPPLTTTTTTTTTTETATSTETTTTTSTGTQATLWGDANVDGKVSLADAVLIMQALSNPDDYQLSEEGKTNADVSNHGDGLSPKDALVIQQVDLKLYTVEDLPLYDE